MNPRKCAAAAACRQAGFTLAEMLVALAVTALLLLGVLATFDFSSRVARAQSYVSDMQQSLRIAQDDMVRLARMAGRGDLTFTEAAPYTLPQGVSIAIRDNVPDNELMVPGDLATRILPGTDVLTVRGVFTTLYYVNKKALTFTSPTTGKLVVPAIPIGATNRQDLAPLKAAIDAGSPEALVLVDEDNTQHVVVELVKADSSYDGDSVTLGFQITGTLADGYAKLANGGVFPAGLKDVTYVGIVDEYRYYVREEHVVAADRTSDLAPKLARARFYPGSSQLYMDQKDNGRLDLADNIMDLQAAFAFDSSNGGQRSDDPDNIGPDDQILETADGKDDDWLLNGASDNPGDAVWLGPPAVQYVRVTTLARTDRRDPYYQAPVLPDRLENHLYAADDPLNSYASRMYRWRTLQTVIDLRNL